MSQRKQLIASAKPLIAIVEDDDSLRPALDGLVRSLGYSSEVFPTAEAFLSSDASKRANCVVSDFQLPGMNGIELAAKLLELIPVIIITARTESALDVAARENGVICLLRKPFEADDFASCIRSALNARHGCTDEERRDRPN